MANTAVHLEQRMLPAVPIRHWIGSLPWSLRALLGYDRRLCAQVVGAFAQKLMRSVRQRAKRLLGVGSVAAVHTAAILAAILCYRRCRPFGRKVVPSQR